MAAVHHQQANPTELQKQDLSVWDQERIEKLKKVRMLRSVLQDCQQVNQELKELKTFVARNAEKKDEEEKNHLNLDYANTVEKSHKLNTMDR